VSPPRPGGAKHFSVFILLMSSYLGLTQTNQELKFLAES
jgi:hypothetical protein